MFNEYNQNLNLYAIGLTPGQTFVDFQVMVNSAFKNQCESNIGNIIFKVDSISSAIIDGFKSNGIKNFEGIKPLPVQQANKQIHSNIAYK